VIDMVQDFLETWDLQRKQSMVRSINDLVNVIRQADCPLILLRQEFEPDLRDAYPEMKAKGIHVTIEGTPGCQIVPELSVDSKEACIVKKPYSAFFGTNLDKTLNRLYSHNRH
jgi:nicotinamidase-related amidase